MNDVIMAAFFACIAIAAIMAALAWIEAGTEAKLRTVVAIDPIPGGPLEPFMPLAQRLLDRTIRSRAAFTMLARGSAVAAAAFALAWTGFWR